MAKDEDQDRQRQMRAAKEVAAAYAHMNDSAQEFAKALALYDAARDRIISSEPENGPHGYAGAALIGTLGTIIDNLRYYIEGNAG